MTNPVFSSSPVFGENRRGRGHGPYDARTGAATLGAAGTSAEALEHMYNAPSATTRETGRLTYDDVIVKTAGLLGLLVVTGALAWTFAPGLWVPAMIVGLVLGLVNAFKKSPSPGLISAYAAVQGVFLGGISANFEAFYDGIVLQAVLATVAVFAASLMLFSSGKVRVTPKFTRFLVVSLVGYVIFHLINLGLTVFGVLPAWGVRSMEVMGIPLGLVIGLFAIFLGAMSLIADFDAIQRGVRQGVPAKFAWSAAFGLLVTLIWLYLEFLRLLAILRE